MSFNITALGTLAEVRETVAALTDADAPKSIRKLLAHELSEIGESSLPDGEQISITAQGHLGWAGSQSGGSSSVHIGIVAPAVAATDTEEAADTADEADEAEADTAKEAASDEASEEAEQA